MMSGLVNNCAPLKGPIIVGYSSGMNWWWMFPIALILATCNWPILLFIPDAYTALVWVLRLDAKCSSANGKLMQRRSSPHSGLVLKRIKSARATCKTVLA